MGQSRAGFVAWRPDSVAGRLWLSKLYVIPEYHRTGLGAYALEQVDCAARAMSRHEIRLFVFKKNDRAIRAYLRAGYEIVGEELSDAGNGFVYDDYVMRKTLEPISRPDTSPAASPS
jgi:ribosomal protein S18 acetylase RimI-like enzyme